MVCIYCCQNQADTRDHVPPKCLLRTPYPSDIWTVPACHHCNKSFSMDEEYFRLIVIGKIVRGLDYYLNGKLYAVNHEFGWDFAEVNGSSEDLRFAPDFSFRASDHSWELTFFDSIRFVVDSA